MKEIIILLFVGHLATGLPNYPDNLITAFDISKYNKMTVESFNLHSYGLTDVAREKVTFRLWTRDQTLTFAPLYYGHLRDEPSIRPDKPFKFLIHGWSNDAEVEWYTGVKNEYLKKGDYNVIQVDWSKPAKAFYPLSAGYTNQVGQYVGEFIVDLNQTLGVPFENIHLIGHSLGAHVSGFAGKTVDSQTNKQIGRITGMDPAGPLFLLATAKNKLDQGDASYVDIIHTDGGKFGYMNVLGHADFYPNNGAAPQPGCALFGAYGIVAVASCSHSRSYLIFQESINSAGFVGRECSTYQKYRNGECQDTLTAVMGENVEIGVKGVFYLSTNARKLFAKFNQL